MYCTVNSCGFGILCSLTEASQAGSEDEGASLGTDDESGDEDESGAGGLGGISRAEEGSGRSRLKESPPAAG